MSVDERLLDAGYEDVLVFRDFDYDTALIGVSEDNRAIYDFDLTVEYLCREEGWSEEEAIEWIEYNTLRALPYMEPGAPIVMYQL